VNPSGNFVDQATASERKIAKKRKAAQEPEAMVDSVKEGVNRETEDGCGCHALSTDIRLNVPPHQNEGGVQSRARRVGMSR
jgi:hypothetical protein